jgi:thiol-disulfide isomerase/thioredoxin
MFFAPKYKIEGITAWLNGEIVSLESLKGKVVMIDFWTHGCYNCVNTLPYVKAWYSKYHDLGLEIVSIHTPEFEFEKQLENVEKFVQKNDITYPVGLDNEMKTWNNFDNHYWPAFYLFDKNGKLQMKHFGEGQYAQTEQKIRDLIAEKISNSDIPTLITGQYCEPGKNC